ncbi:MAG TPA: 50S ribosomal protein L4 [Patescibacteria group bacterium]|nr:50S ribosomal protein L4 [Patescibacteria group bacterium]
MAYPLYNQSGEVVKEIKLNPAIFDVKINQPVIHQVAVAQMANARVAIAHTKTKGEVRGGGKKPWKQKGTGRARHGSTRSPLWKGGGVTFGPRNTRNFSQKVNKKMKKIALFSCLTDKAQSQALVLVDKFELPVVKTKEFAKIILNLRTGLQLSAQKTKAEDTEKKSKKASDRQPDLKKYSLSLLVVAGDHVGQVSKIGRNIPGIKVIGANSLNVLDLLQYKNLLLTEAGLAVIEKTYLK